MSGFGGQRLVWMFVALLGSMACSIMWSIDLSATSLTPVNVDRGADLSHPLGAQRVKSLSRASASSTAVAASNGESSRSSSEARSGVARETRPNGTHPSSTSPAAPPQRGNEASWVSSHHHIGSNESSPASTLSNTHLHSGKAPRRSRHSFREPPNNFSNFLWSQQDNCLARRNPRERQRIRILCLGDSITYGNGSHTRLARREPGGNYPLMLRVDEQLKAVLCPDTRVEVMNMGWNGCSVQEGKRCYRNTLAYRSALRRMRTADVVVFILGTNDSKDYNWRGSDAFEEALFEYMKDIFEAGHPKLEVILAAPPPVYPNPLHYTLTAQTPQTYTAFNIRMDRVRNEIRDSVTAVAEDFGVTFLDLYDDILTSKPELDEAGMRMERGEATPEDAALVKKYFHDGVHPFAPTHEIVTSAVRNAIVWALNQTNITRSLTSDEQWWIEAS